jgi:signal transduction histidine kinase
MLNTYTNQKLEQQRYIIFYKNCTFVFNQLKMLEKISLRTLSRLIMGYMIVAFSWWAVNLWRANEKTFLTETAYLELKMSLPNKGINLTQLQQTTEYKAIEKKYHSNHRMIIYEGLFFIGCLILGLWMINRSVLREVEAVRQRRNFMLSITHELKSPLAGMKLILETIGKRTLEPPQLQKLTHNGLKDANRLQQLIEDLLLAARLEINWKPMQEPLSLLELAKPIADALKLRFPEASILLPKEKIIFQGDKQGITAVFQNLMENALKYSPEKAVLEVNWKKNEKDKLILTFTDNGYGIDNAEKTKIFEKFYRIGNEETRQTTGTGLGLHIVSQVVKAHHGSIRIFDNQPKGSIFSIQL